MNDNASNPIGFDMLPFIMKDLVAMVMKKKSLPLEDAFAYIYASKLYRNLLNEDAKMWYLSALALYDLLEKEKANARKQSQDSEKLLLFKAFCIENYRAKENLSAQATLQLFSDNNVFSFLDETFEMLHTQDASYILDTIASYIKNQKKKK